MSGPRSAPPTRESSSAIALIHRHVADETLWLLRWNVRWNAFAFVGGHRMPRETYRACAIREIGEELGLNDRADYTIAARPIAVLRFEAWSSRARLLTKYRMALFPVELRAAESLALDTAEPAVRWLTEDEIRSGRTATGEPVGETAARVLAAVTLIEPRLEDR